MIEWGKPGTGQCLQHSFVLMFVWLQGCAVSRFLLSHLSPTAGARGAEACDNLHFRGAFSLWAPCKSTRVERHAPLLSPKGIFQDTEHVHQAGLRREQCNTRPPRVEIGGVSLARAPLSSFTSFDLHHERHAASTRQPPHRTSGRPAARRYTRHARVAPPQKHPWARLLAPHSSYSFTTTSSTTSTQNTTTSTTSKRHNG
jgi:hypothetical protein